LWGANTNAQYILDPCVATLYCISYLTKINNYLPQKMKIILHKYKHDEQTKTSKRIKKLENEFLNAQQNDYTTSCTYNNIHTIIPFDKIISIYKHMSTTR
jgi:hypothetical protein